MVPLRACILVSPFASHTVSHSIPYISRRRSIGPNSLRPLRSVDILNGSSPSCSRNSLDLHSAYHCNNGYNQQGVLFQNFPASGPLLRYHHYHVTLHPHEIQVSRTSAVRVKCSRKQGHVLRCHPPHNNLLPRLVYIILRLLFRLWIYHPPQRIIPPPQNLLLYLDRKSTRLNSSHSS